MNVQIENQLKTLDHKLTALLEELKVYSEDQLNRKPADNGWSVLQVMHHLMRSESLANQYVQKKLSFQPELKKVGVQTVFRQAALNFYLGSPFKFKAPELISGENLPDQASFWETAKQWKSQRMELQSFLASLPPEMFNKAIYKHPFAGRLSLLGMLKFFDRHFNRHCKQIRKITKHYYV